MIDTAPALNQINEKCCAAFYIMLHCSIKFVLLLYFDLLVHLMRIPSMFNNHHTKRTPDALDRVAKFLEVLFKSPHLLFGAAIWAYGAYWLLGASGLA